MTGITLNFVSVLVKPLIAGGLCALSAYLSQSLLGMLISGKIATILAIGVACVVYVVALLCLKAIQRSDVQMLPKGQKIAKLLEKHGWIS